MLQAGCKEEGSSGSINTDGSYRSRRESGNRSRNPSDGQRVSGLAGNVSWLGRAGQVDTVQPAVLSSNLAPLASVDPYGSRFSQGTHGAKHVHRRIPQKLS